MSPRDVRRTWWEALMGLEAGMPQQGALDRIARTAARALVLATISSLMLFGIAAHAAGWL